MDNGQVIPGLNDDWSMLGAKLMEWVSGFIALICAQELLFKQSAGKAMPVLLLIWMGTTLGLAALRKRFPDEERGLANMCMVSLGFCPPGIPSPAALQPIWSGAPMRTLPEQTEYKYLDLDKVLTVLEKEREQGVPYGH